MIGGVDSLSLDLGTYRAALSIIPQEPFMFRYCHYCLTVPVCARLLCTAVPICARLLCAAGHVCARLLCAAAVRGCACLCAAAASVSC